MSVTESVILFTLAVLGFGWYRGTWVRRYWFPLSLFFGGQLLLELGMRMHLPDGVVATIAAASFAIALCALAVAFATYRKYRGSNS